MTKFKVRAILHMGRGRGDEAEATDSIVGPNKVIGESLHGRIIKRALKTSL